ncbi:MAG TPA: hypothetical protein VMA86_02585 [Acetobacteraceae bacterium]|nr:hypothetical protein [Acetobacteraceae bacterium]
MKELVLHLGMPKTGSSALQVFLARNQAALLERGVDYLPIGEFALGVNGRISAGNGAYLARTLLAPESPARIPDPERHRAEFHAAVARSSAPVGVVSSELFIDARRDALETLIGTLAQRGITVKALYYIRRHDQFLASAYMQQVKRHACTDSPETYARLAYRQHPFLKYHSFYRYLSEIFGSASILCRTYEGPVMQGDGLFRDALATLGIAADGLAFEVPDVNTSLTPKEVAIMLLVNRYRPRMQFSDIVVENAIGTGAMRAGMEHHILPQRLIAEVEDYFRDENRAMAREYFKREELFGTPPYTGAIESIGTPSLSFEDVIGFFGGLMVRYDQRLVDLDQRIVEMGKVIRALRAEIRAPEPVQSERVS